MTYTLTLDFSFLNELFFLKWSMIALLSLLIQCAVDITYWKARKKYWEKTSFLVILVTETFIHTMLFWFLIPLNINKLLVRIFGVYITEEVEDRIVEENGKMVKYRVYKHFYRWPTWKEWQVRYYLRKVRKENLAHKKWAERQEFERQLREDNFGKNEISTKDYTYALPSEEK